MHSAAVCLARSTSGHSPLDHGRWSSEKRNRKQSARLTVIQYRCSPTPLTPGGCKRHCFLYENRNGCARYIANRMKFHFYVLPSVNVYRYVKITVFFVYIYVTLTQISKQRYERLRIVKFTIRGNPDGLIHLVNSNVIANGKETKNTITMERSLTSRSTLK